MAFDFVDLFAGIGGFHASLAHLGGRAVLASEIDPEAAATYRNNWGITPHGDVRDLAARADELVPDHQVLAGGFPCQPFSKSGAQRGMSELRGQLFNEVLTILEAKRPPVVFLENVRNIAGPRQRPVWEAVVDGLRRAGYRTPSEPAVFSPHLLHPDHGGGPQTRDRVYILGTYVGPERAMTEPVEPVVRRAQREGWNPHKWDLERDLLEPRSDDEHRGEYGLTADEREWIRVWNDFLRRTERLRLPGFPMWSTYWRDDAVVDPDAPDWKQSFESRNITFYEANRSVIRAWFRANPQVRTFPPSRQKLEWQAQDGPRDLYECLLHLRPSGIRAKKPTYAPALVAMAQTPIIGPRRRRMTIKEAARLQGFSDSFTFGDQRPSASYKQLGNAIHVGTAQWVLREHVLQDADEIVAAGGESLVEAVRSSQPLPGPAWRQIER